MKRTPGRGVKKNPENHMFTSCGTSLYDEPRTFL
ncbi:hypothetical protein RUMTOR_02862 [[Ruminococcus] torques ATCC 27756]|uniref:Uncharacterized protein n=1 Tax=[Ruminococcus] torques ATCC 27756 TaxID=411460 RepID=A5KRH0_9FIRM|nr:hypothetical protein RUMTOR_02862 [[Ruminococcus] torques ATCC 27756]